MSTHENLPHHLPTEGSSDRAFGIVMTVFFVIISVFPLLHGGRVRIWSLCVAAAFLVPALVAPKVLGPLNRLWMRFGLLLSRITNPIVLGILFFGVVMPTGLIMRLLKKDILRLKIDKSATSYWIDRAPAGPSPESLKNQF